MVIETSKLWDTLWCSKLFQSMYDLRKLTIEGGGEEGYWKNVLSIYPSPLPSFLRRQSENLLSRLQIACRLLDKKVLSLVCSIRIRKRSQMFVETKRGNKRRSRVCHWCTYHILTSSFIYNRTNSRHSDADDNVTHGVIMPTSAATFSCFFFL